jgi:hypothetical protein
MPAFWLILCAIILLPCACFLVLAVSPRLFDQGSQWFNDHDAPAPAAVATTA